jgi:hypothetical protein
MAATQKCRAEDVAVMAATAIVTWAASGIIQIPATVAPHSNPATGAMTRHAARNCEGAPAGSAKVDESEHR